MRRRGWRRDGLLAQFGTRRARAVAAYREVRSAGIGERFDLDGLNRQVFLGDDAFVARMQKLAQGRPDDLNIPRAQRRPPPPHVAQIAKKYPDRDDRDARSLGDRRIQLFADRRSLRPVLYFGGPHRSAKNLIGEGLWARSESVRSAGLGSGDGSQRGSGVRSSIVASLG